MRNIYIYIYIPIYSQTLYYLKYIFIAQAVVGKRPKDHIQKTAKEGCEETSKNIKTNGQENRQ